MISQITQIIKKSILNLFGPKTAIAFSGGIDSSVIATVLKDKKEVWLFLFGTENSQDVTNGRKIANELDMSITEIIVEEKTILEAYGKIYKLLPLGLLTVEILIPVYLVAQAASNAGYRTLFFGSGAEEVFAGYEKYYSARKKGKDVEEMIKKEFKTLPERDIKHVKKICNHFGLEARFPFYNKELAELMFSVPIDERLDNQTIKKGILRKAAALLGVPQLAVERKKQAMQYGSGIHTIVLKNEKMLNEKYPNVRES